MLFRLAAVVANALPERARGSVADLCGFLHYLFTPAQRSNVRENLTIVGSPPARRTILGIYRHQARNIVELFAASAWDDESVRKRIEVDGGEALDEALSRGRGVVLVTAHLGNWELGARYIAATGRKIHVVAGVQLNRLLTGAVRDAKERRGIEVTNPDTPYRRLVRALQANGIIALLLDGDVYTGGIVLRFFGRPTRLPSGAVRLAAATGAPIVAGYSRRLARGRYRIHLEKVLDFEGSGAASEETSLPAVYAVLERFIAENADQWCIFRRFWRSES